MWFVHTYVSKHQKFSLSNMHMPVWRTKWYDRETVRLSMTVYDSRLQQSLNWKSDTTSIAFHACFVWNSRFPKT